MTDAKGAGTGNPAEARSVTGLALGFFRVGILRVSLFFTDRDSCWHRSFRSPFQACLPEVKIDIQHPGHNDDRLGESGGSFFPPCGLQTCGGLRKAIVGRDRAGPLGVSRLGGFRFENDRKVGGGSGAHFPFPLQLTGQIPEKIYTQ